MWCILEISAEYVACMEDVLDQYERPYLLQYFIRCLQGKPTYAGS